jgi:hypothetical protein
MMTSSVACQAKIVDPHTRVHLPPVFVDRGGLVEALREARCTDLLAEHTGPWGLLCRRAILAAVVTSAPPWVVASCRSCLSIAHSAGVDDVVGVAVLGPSARIKDSLPDRRSTLVG